MSGRDVGSEMANMAANLEEKSGRSMSWWIHTVLSSDKTRHGEMVAYLKEQLASPMDMPTSLLTPPENKQLAARSPNRT